VVSQIVRAYAQNLDASGFKLQEIVLEILHFCSFNQGSDLSYKNKHHMLLSQEIGEFDLFLSG